VVVTEGGDRLRDGAQVQLPETAAATTRTAGAPGSAQAAGEASPNAAAQRHNGGKGGWHRNRRKGTQSQGSQDAPPK
jgi:hypothetical protein